MMTPVLIALAVEVVLVVAAVLAVVGHAVVLAWRDRRRGDVVAAGRRALQATVVSDEAVGDCHLATMRRLDQREQLLLVVDMARSLSGRSRERLATVAESLGVVARARRWCRRRSWKRRLLGVRVLSVLGTGSDEVTALLDDPHPEVRAQALEWLADHPSDDGVQALVGALDDPASRCRFIAKNALVRLGGASSPAVRRRLAPTGASGGDDPVPPGHAARHAARGRGAGSAGLRGGLDVAAWIADTDFLAVARELATHPDEDVRAGAMRVLGSIGGPEAEEVLEDAVQHGSDIVRVAAARSLGRLGQWRAGRALAELLGSPAWEVRRAGVLALLDLGAPGVVLLRRAAASGDVGAGQARQALETRSVTRSDTRPAR